MSRPRKDPTVTQVQQLPLDVSTAAETRGLSPLAYMLRVLNDPKASPRRRDRMAVVAARYLHRRPADSAGKKAELLEASRQAGGDGTDWANDLDVDRRQ